MGMWWWERDHDPLRGEASALVVGAPTTAERGEFAETERCRGGDGAAEGYRGHG
jgi:hypothetical protein